MQNGADSMEKAIVTTEKSWFSAVRKASLVGALGLLVTGCDSYNPVDWVSGDGPPKPQQIALPAEDDVDAQDIPEGLVADSSGQKYDETSGRDDVTVVRPLRNSKPPEVTVGAQGQQAPQPVAPPQTVPVTEAETAGQSDLPGEPPVLNNNEKGAAMASAPIVDTVPDSDALQGLDRFTPQSYGVSFLAATIPFNHGSAYVNAEDRAVLKQVVAQYKDSGGAITVVGHASSRTADMAPVDHKIANFEISVRRAQSVARALIDMGIPARALFVGAVSDNEPVYKEVMPAGEAQNRRTEIFLNQ